MDNSVSCGSCHKAESAFADPGNEVSAGIQNTRGLRNAPTLGNVAYNSFLTWIGSATTLEAQAVLPMLNQAELATDTSKLSSKLSNVALYRALFIQAYGDNTITVDRIAKAIATFERTIITGNSPYDAFNRGDKTALSTSAQHGMQLFMDKNGANCVSCHSGPNFSDNQFHSTGLEQFYEDPGRETITQLQSDNGKFKTPSLRNVAQTAPYEHNGKFATLQEVLDHYNQGGMHNSTQDSLIKPLNLSQSDMNDIIAFLQSLSDSKFTSQSSYKDPWSTN